MRKSGWSRQNRQSRHPQAFHRQQRVRDHHLHTDKPARRAQALPAQQGRPGAVGPLLRNCVSVLDPRGWNGCLSLFAAPNRFGASILRDTHDMGAGPWVSEDAPERHRAENAC